MLFPFVTFLCKNNEEYFSDYKYEKYENISEIGKITMHLKVMLNLM